jgi:quercetin dioxygenase-like cupin family protein
MTMDNLSNKLAVTGPADGPCVSVGGGNYRIVLPGEQTAGEFAVIDMLVPAGSDPSPHAHADMQESFYVLEGEVEIRTEERIFTAAAGSIVNIPRGGMVHCFKNKSDKVARLW